MRSPSAGPSASASLNEALPELQQLALNFLATFFSLVLLQFSSAWALYVALSSLILPLSQPIQPFTTNKALLGPPLHTIGPFFPLSPLCV